MVEQQIVEQAATLGRLWANTQSTGRADRGAKALGKLLAEPRGLDFAVEFVDRVARPQDSRAAGRALTSLTPNNATFLGPVDKALLTAGSGLATYAPSLVVPLARARLRALVGHLVVDAAPNHLTRHIANTLARGHRLNLSLLGEEILGERQARQHLQDVIELLRRPDVDYVSVKVSSLVSQINPWDLEKEAMRVSERLHKVLTEAMVGSPHKFVNLDMESYQDLALTVDVFEELLSREEFMHLSCGIVLQAYLPDSVEALSRLIAFAQNRVNAGGAPIKVRIVKGANLQMERVNAEVHNWPLAPYDNKPDVDANFLRLLDHALRPDVAYALRTGVASHNLFHVAYAHELASARGVDAALDVEMLHGLGPAEVQAVAKTVTNPVVLYTPVVARENFDNAIAYLMRRLEEVAAPGNFLHDVFQDDVDAQEHAFTEAVNASPSSSPRRSAGTTTIGTEFANTPNSDPALAATRTRVAGAVTRKLPKKTVPRLKGAADVDAAVEAASQAGVEWAKRPATKRAKVLRSIAQGLENRRSELTTVMALEAGKTVAEADPEISEAIDFARYYATSALELERFGAAQGATFTPDGVVLVTPPWNFPVAIPIGGVCAALAAGAAVMLKPAPQTPLCVQVAMEAVHEALVDAKVSTDTAQIRETDEGDTGRALVSHPDVDRVILTGAYHTAQLFTSWRSDREAGAGVLAETSGKNAIIVTPSADEDLAVADIVHSAYSHAGQKCSAASLIILVGSMGTSERFRTQLVDAVESLMVDYPTNLSARVGPLIAPAQGKLKEALTTLSDGEGWLVRPHQLDDHGKMWRPGLKTGVQPGSAFHQTEYFGPVAGVMVADSLEQAIEWQNATDYGLTAGIHSLDPEEVDYWLEHVQAGNLYVNRTITGAIVRRQPFGGWKDSSVGPGAKAGGPHYVAQLGQWEQHEEPTTLGAIGPRVGEYLDHVTDWLTDSERNWLRTAARSDGDARETYRGAVDWTGLRSESNEFRYRPGPRLTIRAGENTSLVHTLRLQAAALAAGVDAGVSVHPRVFEQLPQQVQQQWEELRTAPTEEESTPQGVPHGQDLLSFPAGLVGGWRVETRSEFTTRASTWVQPGRIRALDSQEVRGLTASVSTSINILGGPALQSGHRELLTFLREQSVSKTLHRYGYIPNREPGKN